jgi:GT2 family glycosyltransferase
MPSPCVHVIILSFNGKMLTGDCIDSCLKLTYDNFKLILVDNASGDGSVAYLKEKFVKEIADQKIIIIQNPSNLGFAAGNNVGLAYALDHGAEFVLLLNNDTLVDAALLSNLIPAVATDARLGIAGPKIYYFEPADQIWFAGGTIELSKGRSRHRGIREKDNGQYDQQIECDYVTGCAMLIKRAVIETVGYLDPIFTMYSEDADYCLRAKKKQFKMVFVPSGKVWHKISAATGGQLNLRKILLRLHSNFIFYARYARWYHWFTIPIFFILDSIRIVFSVATGRIRNS